MNDSFAIDSRDADMTAPPFKVVLINPYELGRQSFNLAAPTALLKAVGCEVACLDLHLRQRAPAVGPGRGLRTATSTEPGVLEH